MASERVIYVTGFGPFSDFKENPSQLVAEHLCKISDKENVQFKLVSKIYPVDYEQVNSGVPNDVLTYRPCLIVNLGVSGKADSLTLEKYAHKSRYTSKDVQGCIPENGMCTYGISEKLSTTIPLENIAEEVNRAAVGIQCCTSSDAGRYLCEFIYYCSLSLESCPAIFIHIPPFSKYRLEVIALGVMEVIKSILKYLRSNFSNTEEES